jgi:hypothetical protein
MSGKAPFDGRNRKAIAAQGYGEIDITVTLL